MAPPLHSHRLMFVTGWSFLGLQITPFREGCGVFAVSISEAMAFIEKGEYNASNLYRTLCNKVQFPCMTSICCQELHWSGQMKWADFEGPAIFGQASSMCQIAFACWAGLRGVRFHYAQTSILMPICWWEGSRKANRIGYWIRRIGNSNKWKQLSKYFFTPPTLTLLSMKPSGAWNGFAALRRPTNLTSFCSAPRMPFRPFRVLLG